MGSEIQAVFGEFKSKLVPVNGSLNEGKGIANVIDGWG